ncbi:Arylsulfatase [Paenibacillus solanacearum]|uniref:Arylsulfatase n=1 Tax=Paenibacillus solanacearum TaxID=2048548 RepID=A0A916JUZ4_9BACL|nr:arylsulfatase [Paenibacillus solanacearum]CAG7600924.1 Arylsulfatase [Paenibacillus solanacearum]
MNKQPNIIVILADDMGFSDIGAYGSEIHTPNLDRLAREGLRFSQFYNTPRCCPTRASLMTGLYPHQAGLGFMEEHIGNPAYTGAINKQCVTIAEALGDQYHSLMVGKWHLGKKPGQRPFERGFDDYTGLLDGASNYFKPEPGKTLMKRNAPYQPPEEGFYTTDWFSDSAAEYIEQYGQQEKPFFLYLAYTAPHWPLQAHPEDIAKYAGSYMVGWDTLRKERYARLLQEGILDERNSPLTARDSGAPAWDDVEDKEAWDLKMAVYAAMVHRMDQGIGKVLDKLKELQIEDNTLVMFLSDNGACAEGIGLKSDKPPGTADSFIAYHLPWANVSTTPFRLYKHMVNEGGISTPFMARWPEKIKQGAITHQFGHLMDIMATCLDAAGVAYPSDYQGNAIVPLEGKSLLPIFEGSEREGHEFIFWEHEGNRAVRQGKWKLLSRCRMDWQFTSAWGYRGDRGPHEEKWELYNMEEDRVELNDLADQYPEKVQELALQHEQWAQRAGVIPWSDYMKVTKTDYLLRTQEITP